MKKYKVTGIFSFREHHPGQTFVANLDPDSEKRALERGNIEIIFSYDHTIEPSKIRRPALVASRVRNPKG